jgi:hypothetical protein
MQNNMKSFIQEHFKVLAKHDDIEDLAVRLGNALIAGRSGI